MWTAILGVVGKGLWGALERWGLVGGAYVKGRSDSTAAAENAGARARREAKLDADRLSRDERRKRLLEWKR